MRLGGLFRIFLVSYYERLLCVRFCYSVGDSVGFRGVDIRVGV